MRTSQYLFAGIAYLSAATCAGHSEAWRNAPGPNGGALERTGEYRLELCLSEGKVRVWVWDHFREGAPIHMGDAKGLATMISGTTQTTIALKAQLGNLLEGMLDPVNVAFTEITVSVGAPARSTRSARFTELTRARRCRS